MARTLITPEMASELLTHNNHNRKITKARVREYAKEMSDNMWLYNGESIIISESGRLLDGQHRLLAVIEADVEVEMELVTGIPDEDSGVDTFLTINTKNRSNVDALTIAGFHDRPQQIVKLLRSKEAFERKQLHRKTSGIALLNHEVVELAREFGEKRAIAIVDRAETLHTRCNLLAINFWILAVYVFEQVDRGTEFLEKLAECDMSNRTNPVSAYTRLLDNYARRTGGGGSINKAKWIGMFKAYHFMMAGTDVSQIRINQNMIDYPIDYASYVE